MDMATRIEVREAELDAFVARRHDQRLREQDEDHRTAAAWAQTAERYNSKRHKELVWAWLRHHEAMLRNHERTYRSLTKHHQQEIRKYQRILGLEEEVA